MKSYTILFTFFAILFSSQLDAKLFDATIVDVEGKTIKCQIKANMMLFRDEVNPLFVIKPIRAILSDGSKVKFRPDEVQRLTLHTTPSGMRVFESHQVKKKRYLLEVVSTGPIPLFKKYTQHGYDGSVMARYALKDPYDTIVLLNADKWRRHLTEIYPHVPYFEQEFEQRNFKFRDLEEFLAGYTSADLAGDK
ncbi:hypothetical protein [Neolewinella persica]|uniref:hypothetical protein n=1 Tax=Neolewinella persica TaxID=70998 RepID=UPI00035DF48B|nr:hypothetical protein [Neolewinella persica]